MGILAKAYDRIARQGMGRALRHRHFRTFMLTDIVSNIGVWIYRVGGGWLTWDLTHSGFWLGVFSLAQALPGMVLLPLSGAVADRVDRLRIIRTTQSIGMVLAGTLTLLTFSGLITCRDRPRTGRRANSSPHDSCRGPSGLASRGFLLFLHFDPAGLLNC